MSIERVRAYFKELGREGDILEFPVSSATVELAAQAVGVIPARIAKTLSFLVDGKCVLIVAAGDAKVDNSKYKGLFHTKAKMLTPEQAVERSVRRQRHRRTFLFFPYALPYGVQRAAVPEPPALPRDTHRHGFKARTLHGVQNGAGRLQRDRMLGGLSPEQHGDFYFFHLDGPFPLFVENRTIVPHVPDGRAGERLSKILRHSEHPLKRGRSQRHLFYNKFLKSH